jgi:hypothetical protein
VITDDAVEPIEAIPIETTPNPLGQVLAWCAVVLVVVVAGWWVWTRWIDPPVGGTIAQYTSKSGGVVFEDPNTAQFTVTMPSKYETATGSNEWGTIFTVNDSLGDYDFTVTKTPQPADTLANYRSALDTLAGKVVSDEGAELVSQKKPLPLLDVAFKEVVYKKGDTWWRTQFRLLKDRLYTITAKTPNDDPAPYDTLANSFKILGPR